MTIHKPTLDEIERHFDNRIRFAEEAFEVLEESFDCKTATPSEWLLEVRKLFRERFESYASQAKLELDLVKRKESRYGDLAKLDYTCRIVFFRPGDEQKRFRTTYARSEGLIEEWRHQHINHFWHHWPNFVKDNTDDLIAFGKAIFSDPPDLASLCHHSRRTINRTRAKAIELLNGQADQ